MVHVAQPALSQAVAALEQELKVPLLLRGPQGVTPTPAGDVLYRRAVSIVRMVEAAQYEVRTPEIYEAEGGDVSVGIPPTFVPLIGFPLFERMRAEHPRIRVHIVQNLGLYLGEMLRHGQLDMSITFRHKAMSRTALVPLIQESFFVVGDAPTIPGAGDVCNIEHLRGVPLVIPNALHGMRELIEQAFTSAGVDSSIIGDIDSVDVLLRIAKAGMACTILPFSALPVGYTDEVRVRQLNPQVWRPVSILVSTSREKSGAALIVQRTVVELMLEFVRSGRLKGARLFDDE